MKIPTQDKLEVIYIACILSLFLGGMFLAYSISIQQAYEKDPNIPDPDMSLSVQKDKDGNYWIRDRYGIHRPYKYIPLKEDAPD